MALLQDKDKIAEFENLKEYLDEIDIPAEIIKKRPGIEDNCLVIALPSNEDHLWDGEEVPEDGHFGMAYLMQIEETENQMTKYLMLYTQIMVDVTEVEEMKILKLLNEVNRTSLVGHFFYAADPEGVERVQYKAMIGGSFDAFIDEPLVCQHVLEMAASYDKMKEALLALK